MTAVKALKAVTIILFVIAGIIWMTHGVFLFRALPDRPGPIVDWLTGLWSGFGISAGIVYVFCFIVKKRT